MPAVSRARYRVFPPGGARGMALVGELEAEMDCCGVDFGADRVVGADGKWERRLRGAAGTSIGAYMALLVTLGYSVPEIRKQLDGLKMEDIAAPNPVLIFTELKAADDGRRLQALLSTTIERKLGVRDVTLAELRRRTGVDLVTVASDKTTGSVRYLRADTEPAMSTVQAVFASMALPPLFPSLLYKEHELEDGGGMDYLAMGAWGDEARGLTVASVLHTMADLNHCDEADAGAAGAGITSASTGKKKDKGAWRGSVLASLNRSMHCALYPATVAQWCLLQPIDRASCVVIDVTDVPVLELDIKPEVKERVRRKGYQDTVVSLRRMAAGEEPRPPTARFARREGLPPYLYALMDAAAAADRAFYRERALEDRALKDKDTHALHVHKAGDGREAPT